MYIVPLIGQGTPLTALALNAACGRAGVDARHLWAVIFVETDFPNGGYLRDRRPQILYEPQQFSGLTDHAYDETNPDISSAVYHQNHGTYNDQYLFLAKACALDQDKALQSCSWGIGQTLGENYQKAGFADVTSFVLSMVKSEDDQVSAMAAEMVKLGAAKALAKEDWATFARLYNGTGFASNQYDQKVKAQFDLLQDKLPDLRIRTAQCCLWYEGFNPGMFNGLWENPTLSAWHRYQASHQMQLTDTLDEPTYQILVKPYIST
ncbi:MULTISPECIES: N-acetylmuramidase family protein [unclassified Dyella]|uniref:N-acetylmuramidase family protein n=1 Tax=unclassified Dyella TaxID=2634549 RepID=UPI000CB7F0DB|nr:MULTISPECIES: N-acetylmuramidase family protein [unclassified Dyella]MDR3446999.1 N-acetylmuramidase family protein [Dyella sp.]PMQ05860.1 hypothetical protein DyAD56_06340 [Dyella sp. AD56]